MGQTTPLSCSELEKFIGIENYYVSSGGIGGLLKERPEDFIVSEVVEGGLDGMEVWDWAPLPHEPSRFSLWILRKRNRTTLGSLALIAKELAAGAGEVKICGIKDRRAVTYQFVALPAGVSYPAGGKLVLLGGDVEARHIGYVRNLKTHDLLANRFEVVIRDFSATEQGINTALSELSAHGAPNYFGPQRFGSLRPVAHLVGRHIVRGELREAIAVLIGFHTEFEPETVRRARLSASEHRGFREVLENLPRSLVYERAVCRHLAEREDDYAGALRRLPIRLRRLFVEAYSSYIFNRALSLSLRDGLRLDEPREGDLIVRLDPYQRPYGRVIPVDRWNIEEAATRVARGEAAISLPQLGYLTWLPRGPRGDALRTVLDEEGVSTSSFKVRHLPELSTRGKPRPILLRPRAISREIVCEDSLVLRFALPPSSYATSLLRELMKVRCGLAYVGLRHCYA
jgi:tRNA pseudouridine13 synthase